MRSDGPTALVVSQVECVKMSPTGRKPHDHAGSKYHRTLLAVVVVKLVEPVPVSVVIDVRSAHASVWRVPAPVGRHASMRRALVHDASTVEVLMMVLSSSR
jgi:hypothetical protein